MLETFSSSFCALELRARRASIGVRKKLTFLGRAGLNSEIKATGIYSIMIVIGLIVAALFPYDRKFSFGSILASIPFLAGLAISILGLHEICHVGYCKIKGIEIIGVTLGLKAIGIKVRERDKHPEDHLSSSFSIPITIIVSIFVQLPYWILLFNIFVVCFACISDVRSFLHKR